MVSSNIFNTHYISQILMSYDEFKNKINSQQCWIFFNPQGEEESYILSLSNNNVIFNDNQKEIIIIYGGNKINGGLAQWFYEGENKLVAAMIGEYSPNNNNNNNGGDLN